MSGEFIFLMTVIMASRLLYIGRDGAVTLQQSLIAPGIQLLGLLWIGFGLVWGMLLLIAALLAGGLYLAEKRAGAAREGLRFGILMLWVLVLSTAFAPGISPGFNEALVSSARMSGHVSLIPGWLQAFGFERLMLILFAALLLALEVNFVIRWVLQLSGMVPGNRGGNDSGSAIDQQEYRAGRLIGILERLLILFFVLVNQFTAIAFIIAAKGIARFKELEERRFAEYVLIGTLLSTGLAMIVALVVRAGLPA